MKKKVFEQLIIFCFFPLALFTQAYGASIELMPYIDGTLQYHHSCIFDPRSPDVSGCDVYSDQIIPEISILNTGCYQTMYLIEVTDVDQHIGIVEFDISSLYGLLMPGKIKADLVLTIKSIPTSSQTIKLSDIYDADEDGVITFNDSLTDQIGELSGLFTPGDIIMFDVTSALEHDLFGSDQTIFSGYVIQTPYVSYATTYYGCLSSKPPVHTNLISFYDHTAPEFAPRLIVSDTTLIQLVSFTATAKRSQVILSWSTESEIDNAGFNIYRSDSENGAYTIINDSPIAAKGSATQGAAYEFIDHNVKNGKKYYYKLEDVDVNGLSTFHSPVSATPRFIYGIK